MSNEGHWWKRRLPVWVVVASIPTFTGYLAGAQMQAQPTNLEALQYRFIGPPGNRVIAVIGVPGDPNTYFVGAASGGIWKSTDGGINWRPVFDDQPAQSIGSLAIAPSDPSIVWAGTGETFIRSNISAGNGIYKSSDSGETWTHMGLENTGRIGRIVIHPRDPNVVFAAALGHCYGPQPDRGVYRTTDGGKTWEKVLFVDENTGASDLAIDPSRPEILFAGTWQVDIKTWGRRSGGPGSGVFRSTDGGGTWSRLIRGLPEPPLGKIAVAVAPSNSERVYALIETGERGTGTVWRSDDGGENWKLVNHSRSLNGRPNYTTRMAISPVDHNELYFVSDILFVSFDGGETHEVVQGGDNHDMWFDPTDADRIMIGNDGGAMISRNHGADWQRVVLPVAQMYHVHVDDQIPYYVYGARQDGPAYRGPSNSLDGASISSAAWVTTGGCESGMVVPTPGDPNLVWGGCFAGGLDTWDPRTSQRRSVRVWPESSMGWHAGGLKYRFQWTFPISISPHDPNTVYVGSQHVHKTTNRGQSWTDISPDLSTGDEELLQVSGGLTPDNLGPEYGAVVFAIAESPLEKGLIWAGTNDGRLHVTPDGGAHWTDVTPNIPQLPPLGTISNIEPSRFDAGTCYVSVDLHQVNNRDPFIYKTADYGKTWKLISSTIPKSVFSYVHVVREDPVRKGLLYAGTENALYVSFDNGEDWVPLQNNMPHAPVHWLVVQPHFNDLVVATYGRGFYILDDVTPLQQLTPKVLESDIHLFAPRPVYRFSPVTSSRGVPNDQSAGRNPRYGASINYYLKAVPKGDVVVVIEDEAGQIVRTLPGPRQAGISRVWWDLRYEPPPEVKLRTTPPGYPQVWQDKRYNEARRPGGWRPLLQYRSDDGKIAPRVIPSTYTVKLSVGGQSFSETLVVKKDPNTPGTDDDVRAKGKVALEIHRERNTAVDMYNRTEWIRAQLEYLRALFDEAREQPLKQAAAELDKKLIDVQGEIAHPVFAEGDIKHFRAPTKLLGRFQVLLWDLESSADFPPTDSQLGVLRELKQELEMVRAQLSQVLERDLTAFNKLLEERNLRGVIVPTADALI